MATGVLEGIRVVELAEGLAGPLAGRLLAESGAEVIKVESPEGDRARSAAGFATWNRSKRSVVLDITSKSGLEQLGALLHDADVLIHSFTPAQAAGLGLDDASLTAKYPELVVSGIAGYPQRHDDRDRVAEDTLVMARMGLMDEQRGYRDGPIYLRIPLGSWGAVYLATIGILSRLIHRGKVGRGGVANTSLFQGALIPMTMHWATAENPSPSFAMGLPKDGTATLFECADGVWIHLMGVPDNVPMMKKCFEEFGPEKIAEYNATFKSSMAYPNSGANRAAMKLYSSKDWLNEFWTHDVPAQAAMPMGEIFFDEQARINGYVIDVEDPQFGKTQQAGIPYMTEPAPKVTSAAPRLNEHAGGTWSNKPRAKNSKSAGGNAPLAGLKVLDFGNFLAGPLAPMLMADLGADVIKLETTTGDQMRFVERVFAGCQRGKRDIAVDLKKPESREILERIVKWADVVHHNIRMPAAIKLGIDEPTLRKINPTMVYCHTSSYGPIGPRKDWPGYDQLFQSSCGWEYEGAGEGNQPMWHRFGMMDHQCAMASVVATLLGVMRRDETGEGQTVSASLLGAALLTTSETLVLPDGKLAPYPRLDNRQTGVSPTDRIYQLSDGWIAVVARTTDQMDALCRVAGVTTLEAVEAAFTGRTCASTLTELEQAGVPCEPVRLDQTQEFLFGNATTSAGLVASYDHLAYGAMRQVGGLWDFGDLDLKLDTPPPVLGQNSAAILRELGFDESSIKGFAESGAVVAADLA